jgi:hypothetical protein
MVFLHMEPQLLILATKGGRQVPDAEFIAGALVNVGLEIAYSKTATQTDVGSRAVCFESPALPSRWVLTLQLPPTFPICL